MSYEHFYFSNNENYTAELFRTKPSLLYAGIVENEPAWKLYEHYHKYAEIVFVQKGEGVFIINGVKYTAGPGDLLIYNAGVKHEESSCSEKPLKTMFCAAEEIKIRGLKDGCIISDAMQPVFRAEIYADRVESLLSDLINETASKAVGHEYQCLNILSLLIITIMRITGGAISQQAAEQVEVIKKMRKYFDENYTARLNLEDAAKSLYLSQGYISHLFKNETGSSPVKYMIKKRIELAKKLLVSTNKRIYEISEIIGYEDPNYFSHIFKHTTGVSPTEFRKEKQI